MANPYFLTKRTFMPKSTFHKLVGGKVATHDELVAILDMMAKFSHGSIVIRRLMTLDDEKLVGTYSPFAEDEYMVTAVDSDAAELWGPIDKPSDIISTLFSLSFSNIIVSITLESVFDPTSRVVVDIRENVGDTNMDCDVIERLAKLV